jgi:anti-anti-sigma factor
MADTQEPSTTQEPATMAGSSSIEISHYEIAPNIVVIRVAGKVMMGPESEQITTLVNELLKPGKHAIIFDIAGITKIDSTGIGRFISSYNQVAAKGGHIRMAAAPQFVFQAFHVCRLDTVFQFYATVEDACQAR